MDCRSLGTVASQTDFSHAHALVGIPTKYSWFTTLVTELVLGTHTHTHTISRQQCGVCIICRKWVRVRDSSIHSVKGVSDITQERERESKCDIYMHSMLTQLMPHIYYSNCTYVHMYTFTPIIEVHIRVTERCTLYLYIGNTLYPYNIGNTLYQYIGNTLHW